MSLTKKRLIGLSAIAVPNKRRNAPKELHRHSRPSAMKHTPMGAKIKPSENAVIQLQKAVTWVRCLNSERYL